MTQPYQTLLSRTIDDTVVVLSLNRPDSANALNSGMAMDIRHFFESLAAACRVVIVTGAGRHFCAGADLKDRKGMDQKQWQVQHHAFEAALQALMHCPVPVIAAVNGAAMGGGLELALACDFIYAADTARFALTETTLGLIPGMGGTQALPRIVGMARAKELMFLGRVFSAAEALQWGMVNRVCTAETLLDEIIACAGTISCNAPLAVKAAKQAINEGLPLPIEEALQCELRYYNTLIDTQDRQEGINAFNEKRKAIFTGN